MGSLSGADRSLTGDGRRLGWLSHESGQAGIALVIIIAWALTAVLMLTVTLVTAQQIQDRVDSIRGSVTAIKGETALVALTTEINQSASGILVAASPLAPKLEEVDASVKSIDSSVKSILATAQSIGATVNTISGQAKSILAVVHEIRGKPGGGLDGLGVADINERVAIAQDLVNQIKGDTGAIRAHVNSKPAGTGIHYHLCALIPGAIAGLNLLPGLVDGHC